MDARIVDGRKIARVTDGGSLQVTQSGKIAELSSAQHLDAADATLHDKLDALLAYYKDAEDNTIHDKLDAMTTLLTTMSATLTSMLGVLEGPGGGGTSE